MKTARGPAKALGRPDLDRERLDAPTGPTPSRRRSACAAGRLRQFAIAALLATALLASTAGPASAARGHVFDEGLTLGEPCPALEVPCGPGKLKEPSAVAVNEATNQVYVLDQGNARVEIFNGATGVVEGEIDGSGLLPGEGTEAGAGGHPGESGGTGSLPGEVGTPSGRFSFGAEPQNGALAVDNSCALHEPPLTESTSPTCATFDPSAGDLYVADTGHRVVDKFTAAGAYLGQVTEGGGEQFASRELKGIAVDPAGGLWVYREGVEDIIFGFDDHSPINGFTKANNYFVAGVMLPGFAVDSEGDFYIRKLRSGHPGELGRISKLGPSSEQILNEELESEESAAVAVEQSTDTSFVDNITSVGVFDPSGTEVERLGTEGGVPHLTAGQGVGVDAASGFVFVADSAAGHAIAFRPELPGAPTISTGSNSVRNVTATSADLGAELNPRSEPFEAPTTYRFEYGPCAGPTTCPLSPFTLTTPDQTLPPDFNLHQVTAHLTGLQPGTAYHFRLSAENSHDPGSPVLGEEGTFTTQTAEPFALPDSRRWEIVSPPAKHGANIPPLQEVGIVQAAASGGAITYQATAPIEADPAGNSIETQVLSARGPSGWSSRGLSSPNDSATGTVVGKTPNVFFSADLSHSVLQPVGAFVPQLSSEASEQTAFLRTDFTSGDPAAFCTTSCYRPLVTGAPGFANVPAGTHFGEEGRCPESAQGKAQFGCGPKFVGAGEDLAHVVLSSRAALTPGAPENPTKEQLYEWSDGRLAQISVLPGGGREPESAGLAGSGRRAISTDGSRIFWHTNQALYLRADATDPQSASGACDEADRACTLQLDAAEPGCLAELKCESGGGVFEIASSDGSRIFFTDFLRLTANSSSTPETGGKVGRADLYECRIVESPSGGLDCDLTDLTPKTGGEAASVQGGVLGASEDGSRIYFVAGGVLATNTVDNGAGSEEAQSGQPNLYLDQDGSTTFITTLAAGDGHDWSPELSAQPTRVSPDGRWLELMSERSLTGYDNRDAATGRPVAEVFLYDATTKHLSCASCDPTGARPHGVPYTKLDPDHGGLVGGPTGVWTSAGLVAATVPGWSQFQVGRSRYQDRYLSDSGRLFYNADDALVPADSNGTFDVYEYEPPGVGSCTASSPTYGQASGGCVGLISSGTSGRESAFLDASENGDDVFFLTASQLSARDTDTSLDVYDARVGGGEPEIVKPVECEGDGCQQPAVPPNDATPGSLTFSGAGNVKECPKGKQLKQGKCVKQKAKKHKKKAHKKNGKKSSKAKRQGGHR